MNGHLLKYDNKVEGIVKLILEKIVLGDPPFLSSIADNRLYFEEESVHLGSSLTKIETFIRENFNIPVIRLEWKDIKKQSLKNYLIHQYSRDKQHLLSIHLDLAGKRINADSIVMNLSEFKINSIPI